MSDTNTTLIFTSSEWQNFMAQKRKAQVAFGQPTGQLSAVAAARLAKQSKAVAQQHGPTDAQQRREEIEQQLRATSSTPTSLVVDDETQYSDAEAASVEIQVGPRTIPIPAPSPWLDSGKAVEADDGSLEVTLLNDESIVCVGEFNLEVQKGLVVVCGATLHPESGPQRVYAPSTHAVPRIIAKRNGTKLRLFHVNSTIAKLTTLSPLFRNIWTKQEQRRTFELLRTAGDDQLQRSLVSLDIDKTTETVIGRIAASSQSTARLNRILTVGAKSSGKSTFNRILCNTLISKPAARKVLYLDIDPGQPEFGPPGQVSLIEVSVPLLGPSFTHPAYVGSTEYRLIRSHTLAAISFKDDVAHYIACAKELVRHADRRQALIVNACGWTSGQGASVTQELAEVLGITHIALLEPVDPTLVEKLRNSCPDAAFHALAREPIRPSSRTPAELRAMQTMAYFHSRPERSASLSRWTGKAISTWRPWIIQYDGAESVLRAVVAYGQQPHPDFLAEVLEGSIVALVQVENNSPDFALPVSNLERDTEPEEAPNINRTTAEDLPYLSPSPSGSNRTLDPHNSSCLGLALIRAIDSTERTIHFLTPVADNVLAEVLDQRQLALVRGGFDPAEWALLEDLYCTSERVKQGKGRVSVEDRPWVSRREAAGVGVEGAVWRLRHPPMAGDVR
ncbi:hypothetical protein LTR62_008132 [Meristemomyces frigidus]|uniref:Polynucleotide 5'-hydroxyl-kinase GRC3 n=1 Tax=Meristemomyces frigidus TaxID=1508187 RepID=A0AAN7TID2_9PEZI|nr:hypothetical protein LTR62_008132 [Meristemomyces frigidus]